VSGLKTVPLMLSLGDIVTLPALRDGLWVFAGLRPVSGPGQAEFLATAHQDEQGPTTSCIFGTGNATLVRSPTITPGMTVDYFDNVATVVSDGALVRITYSERIVLPLPGDTDHFTQVALIDVPRAELVRSNISRF
jgi:hypothetical protein